MKINKRVSFIKGRHDRFSKPDGSQSSESMSIEEDDDSQVKGDFVFDDLISENPEHDYKIEHSFIKTMG